MKTPVIDDVEGKRTRALYATCKLTPRILDLEKGFVIPDEEGMVPRDLLASPEGTPTSRLVIDVAGDGTSCDGVSTDGASSAGDCAYPEQRIGKKGSPFWAHFDKVTVTLCATGCFSLLFAVMTTICTPYDVLMTERLKMVPGLPAFDWWLTPPDEVLLRVYLFNITNQKEFMSGEHTKIQMQEIGPYIFREKLQHSNVTFHDNGTMTYTAQRSAIFLPELNTLSLNDTLIVPNLAVLGMASYLSDATFFTKLGFNLLLRRLDSQPLSNVSVYNYMWNLTDPLLTVTRSLVPHLVPVDNMGILHTIYQDFRDEVSVFMGAENGRRFFTMDRFHGKRNLGLWPGEKCDTVLGATEGVSYHQNIKRDDILRYLRKTVCRVTPLTYTRDEEHLGMLAYRFELPDDIFNRPPNSTSETDCYTRPGQTALPSGLTDISPCYHDFPVAASLPHFYSGDPELQHSVQGLHPDRSKHHSYVAVEPTTGVPMEACARSQSNLLVRDVKGFSKLDQFSNTILPMFWAEYNQVGLPWYISWMMYLTVMVLPYLQRVFSACSLLWGLLALSKAFRRVRALRTLRRRRLSRGARTRSLAEVKVPPLSSYSSLELLSSSGSSGSSSSGAPSS